MDISEVSAPRRGRAWPWDAAGGNLTRSSSGGFSWWWPTAAAVGMVAFAARLAPVLRGGGLFGLGNYDDAVNFAAAAGLAHGLLPYRDFLFLHPPGSTLALLPFALLSLVVGDANSFAVARVAWMSLGAVNAVLVSRVLRPSGLRPALVGGLFYAVFPPAIYAEHSTLLEPPASLCLLAALCLLIGGRRSDAAGSRTVPGGWAVLGAGMLLGAAAGVKIWGVVVVAAVAVWCAVTYGRRCFALLLAGAAVGVAAVCLPFFLVARGAMWRMVVLDQLGRARTDVSLATRLKDMVGMAPLDRSAAVTPLLVAAVLAGVAVCVLAWRTRAGRLPVMVLVAVCALLLTTPSWFLHYAGLIAAPAAVVVGEATGAGERWLSAGRRRTLTAALLVAGFVAFAVPAAGSSLGSPFPAQRLTTTVGRVSGCVTSDDPTTLIELNILSRNLQRHCPMMVDLGGYSYDVGPASGVNVSRRHNKAWQDQAVAYLRGGSVSIVTRFSARSGFNAGTAATVRSWPVLARSGRYTVRGTPAGPSAGLNR